MEKDLVKPLRDVLEWYRSEATTDLIDQADDEFHEALLFRQDQQMMFPGTESFPVNEALYDTFVEKFQWIKPRNFKQYLDRHTTDGEIDVAAFKADAIANDWFRESVEVKVVDELDCYFNDKDLTGDEMRCLRDFVEDWVGPETYIDIMAGDDSEDEREREAYDFTRIFIYALCT